MQPHQYIASKKHERQGWRVALWLLLIIGALAGAYFWLMGLYYVKSSEPQGRLSCSSFGSYAEMMAAFPEHPELDGDNDNVPCQAWQYPDSPEKNGKKN